MRKDCRCERSETVLNQGCSTVFFLSRMNGHNLTSKKKNSEKKSFDFCFCLRLVVDAMNFSKIVKWVRTLATPHIRFCGEPGKNIVGLPIPF